MNKYLVTMVDGHKSIMSEKELQECENAAWMERGVKRPDFCLIKEILHISNHMNYEYDYLEKLVARDEIEYKKLTEINYNQQLKIEELKNTVGYLTDILARTKRMLNEKEQACEALQKENNNKNITINTLNDYVKCLLSENI